MKADKKMVDKLADLSKLEFDEKSREEIINDLNKMLAFVEKLNEVDTTDVEPLIYMTDEVNVLRGDKVHYDITQKDALKNAPKKDSDYFKVPRVLGKK